MAALTDATDDAAHQPAMSTSTQRRPPLPRAESFTASAKPVSEHGSTVDTAGNSGSGSWSSVLGGPSRESKRDPLAARKEAKEAKAKEKAANAAAFYQEVGAV